MIARRVRHLASLAIVGLLAIAGTSSCARLGGGSTEFGRLLAREKRDKIEDASDCLTCHDKIKDFVAASIHRQSPGCETCHGPGAAHAQEPPAHIIGASDLRKLSSDGRSELCLQCHRTWTAGWTTTSHARAGLACFECHTDAVHFKQEGGVKPPRAFASSTAFCEQCHAANVAELNQPYHHPVPEGELTCTSCHTVHGEARRQYATLETDHQACGRCHARQAQEKVFRHAALDEGCQVCHQPHGSPIPMLLARDANNLCLQCHFESRFPVIGGVDHGQFLARAGRCWDCHVDMHGSNSDPSLLGRIR